MRLHRHCARSPFGIALIVVLLTLCITPCGNSKSDECQTEKNERIYSDCVVSKPQDDKFTVNERAEIERAIGPTDGLSDELKRAFALTDEFTILPPPEPGDWLDVHPEDGQTFEEFVQSSPNMPTQQQNVIYLLPLGEFEEGEGPSFETLASYTQTYFTLDVKLLEGVAIEHVNPTERINRYLRRRQLYTPDILIYLKQNLPDDAYCLIALTMVDLYPDPDWNYVFGQASLKERVGIYSFARYDPAFFGQARPRDYRQLILRRSLNIMAHEIGHMFGLKHCIFLLCILNGSNNLEETDRSPLHLCPICLRKLAYVTGFDVVERYRNVAGLYEGIDFYEDAKWIQNRLETITTIGAQDDDSSGGSCFIGCCSSNR